MGTSCNFVVVNGKPFAEVLALLGAAADAPLTTGEEAIQRDGLGAALEVGERSCLIADPQFALVDPQRLETLSSTGTAVRLAVVDSTGYSNAAAWRAGQPLWEVHSSGGDDDDVCVEGSPPPYLAAMIRDTRAGDRDWYSVPILMVHRETGWHWEGAGEIDDALDEQRWVSVDLTAGR